MEDVLSRLDYAITSVFKLSRNALAKGLGINQVTINDQTKGKVALTVKVLVGILNYLPNLSAEWLLRGSGEVLLETTPEPSIIKVSKNENCNIGHTVSIGNEGGVSTDKDEVVRLRAKMEQMEAQSRQLQEIINKQLEIIAALSTRN